MSLRDGVELCQEIKPRCIGKNATGGTLISVAIAALLIGLAAIPLSSLMISETRRTRMSRDRVFATHLARNLVERIRMEPLGQVAWALASPEDGRAFILNDRVLTPPDCPRQYKKMLGRFQRTLVYAPSPDGDKRKGLVEAVVSWSENGRSKQVRLMVLLADLHFRGGRP